MVKTSCYEKTGLRKGAWSEEEDDKLRTYIQRYGHWNWSLLPKFAGVSRSGKSCRLRWMNYLRPNMKHGNFTKQEDDLIISLHNQLGNKWSTIAANLPGRSDNEIKNRWNTNLKKKLDQDDQIGSADEVETFESHHADPQAVINAVKETQLEFQQEVDHILMAGESSSELQSSSSACWLSGTDCALSSDFTPLTFDEEIVGDFWTQPFLPADNNSNIIQSAGDNLLSPYNFTNDFVSESFCQDMIMTDEFIWSTLDTYVEEMNGEFIY